MTNKEYVAKKETIRTYNCYDYLTQNEMSELYHDVKNRVKSGAIKLPDCNNRATYRTDKSGALILTSYYTDVIKVEYINGAKVMKLWDGFSATTLKHINTFMRMLGLPTYNKREWIELDVA